MSQRSPTQGHPLSYEPGSTSAVNSHYASTTSAPSSEQHGGQLPPPHSARGLELPPLLRVPGGRSGSVSPSIPRSVTMPSVLNPVPEDGFGHRRRKADELASPRDSVTTLPPLLHASQSTAVNSASSGSSATPYISEPTDPSGRKLLTPKSPIRRAISLSHLNPASGNINAQQNPFPLSPRSHSYVVGQGTPGAPPLPTPPVQMRQGSYGFPSIVPPPSDLPKRLSPEAPRYSASPSPGYSPYDENSPTGYSAYDHGGSSYLSVGDPSRAGSRGMSVPAPTATSGSQLAVPGTSVAGQSTYQMMTLKTTEGDVRFPVDVQAASRVADEKRKRNAGASARFRERRKKKEMEAASTISKLEQRVKEVSEDADFYKKERDVLAGIIRGMNGGERQLANRPSSPRVRRHTSNPSASGQAGPSNSYHTPTDVSMASPDMGRRVRRRTSSFPMAQAPAEVPQAYGQSSHQVHQQQQQQQQQSYSQSASHVPVAHQYAASALPPSGSMTMLPPATQMRGFGVASQASGVPPPPQVMQAPPMTGPYNPFAARYDPNNTQRPSQGR